MVIPRAVQLLDAPVMSDFLAPERGMVRCKVIPDHAQKFPAQATLAAMPPWAVHVTLDILEVLLGAQIPKVTMEHVQRLLAAVILRVMLLMAVFAMLDIPAPNHGMACCKVMLEHAWRLRVRATPPAVLRSAAGATLDFLDRKFGIQKRNHISANVFWKLLGLFLLVLPLNRFRLKIMPPFSEYPLTRTVVRLFCYRNQRTTCNPGRHGSWQPSRLHLEIQTPWLMTRPLGSFIFLPLFSSSYIHSMCRRAFRVLVAVTRAFELSEH